MSEESIVKENEINNSAEVAEEPNCEAEKAVAEETECTQQDCSCEADQQTTELCTDSGEEQVAEKAPREPIDVGGALRCMMSFFTIIRLDVDKEDMEAMEKNFWLVPFIGFLNGLVALLVLTILGLFGVSITVQAIAAIASMYIFSKFLHFDGLTDFGDGIIVSSGKREDHLRALKDSLIGAGGFGVALMVVLITFACYLAVGNDLWSANYNDSGNLHMVFGVGFAAFMVEILVKNAQVAAAAFGEPGTGMASRQVSMTKMDSIIKSTITTAVLLLVALLICVSMSSACDTHPSFDFAEVVVIYLVSLAISVLSGFFMARVANKTFGFVNGDILGATNEISRAAILLVSLMILGVWV